MATSVIYATPDELRTQIGKQGVEGTASDAALTILLTAASRFLDDFYNRAPGGFIADSAATTRIYKGTGEMHLWVDETIDISSLKYAQSPKETTTFTTVDTEEWLGFRGKPSDPDLNQLPFHGILSLEDIFDSLYYYFVEAKWGFATEAPEAVRQLTIAITSRYYKQGEGAWADTLGSVDVGRLVFKQYNADLQMLLDKTRLYKPAVA